MELMYLLLGLYLSVILGTFWNQETYARLLDYEGIEKSRSIQEDMPKDKPIAWKQGLKHIHKATIWYVICDIEINFNPMLLLMRKVHLVLRLMWLTSGGWGNPCGISNTFMPISLSDFCSVNTIVKLKHLLDFCME